MTHFINKATLDFSFPAKEKGNALQKTKEFFYDKALPQIGKKLDFIHTKLYIEKLEINLGMTTEKDFEKDFYNALIKSLKDYEDRSAIHRDEVEKTSSGFTMQHLLFFLQKGCMPWQFQVKNESEISSALQIFFENEAQTVHLFEMRELKTLFFTERLINLVFAYPETLYFFFEALQKYHPALHFLETDIINELQNRGNTQGDFYQILLRELLLSAPLTTSEHVIQFFKTIINWKEFSSTDHLEEAQDLANKTGDQYDAAFKERLLTTIQKSTGELPDDFAFTPLSSQADTLGSAQLFDDAEAEKIHILNAGLILFHPFLPQVFSALKWIGADQNFVNIRAQQKAILFLQYVINRKSRQAEHLLVLNKIMCNWPVKSPIKTSCIFSSEEKQAAHDLIDSLKAYWTVVKNTSPAGLVQSFIERNGLIQVTADGFLLQAEQKTIDILLESLPFSISTIKLPWNEGIIYTEW